ncbi:class I SAM-dependent methyltransferase [Mariniphaga sediminis]|jgi:SAM-dependent methyltransferase|uniref:class I SAM-dependent methyltransferase n=1 Tax=Mariniphaga sediminis TaxID=1628158 RepID=UPI00356301ED
MAEFWESSFTEMQTEWGFKPSDSAILAKDLFLGNKIKNVLIPGIGYGRNAKIFIENGINVTGIEISKTAIDLARNKNGLDIKIHNGSVTEMPFDKNLYDGIFCYALIHLLNMQERKKFIRDCYNKLKPNGYMIFTVVSKKASMFGNGKQLSRDRYEILKGLNVFFYDFESVKKEFNNYGLIESSEINEPIKHMENEPPLKCILVKCKKMAAL